MIPYSHNIRYTHQHNPICIERQYASCKFEVNIKYQYIDNNSSLKFEIMAKQLYVASQRVL